MQFCDDAVFVAVVVVYESDAGFRDGGGDALSSPSSLVTSTTRERKEKKVANNKARNRSADQACC